MLKRTIAFLLIISLNVQIFSQMGILAWFVLNNEYVAKVLCENKNRPELHCSGQCILAKRLKAAEQQDRQNMANLLKVKEINLFYSQVLPFFLSTHTFSELEKNLFFYVHSPVTPHLTGVFHPPPFLFHLDFYNSL